MNGAPLHIAGQRIMLDPAGVLYWPAEKLLAVADLHLEKGSSFASHGRFVPPYDTRDTLDRLALALRRWKPARLVLLGDSFHDRHGCARLPHGDCAALQRMLDGIEVIWLLGNHDPEPPEGLPGIAVAEWQLGPLLFRHIAQAGAPAGEVSGHFHPKATMPTRMGGVTRPCFLTDSGACCCRPSAPIPAGSTCAIPPSPACSRAAAALSCSAATGCSASRPARFAARSDWSRPPHKKRAAPSPGQRARQQQDRATCPVAGLVTGTARRRWRG